MKKLFLASLIFTHFVHSSDRSYYGNSYLETSYYGTNNNSNANTASCYQFSSYIPPISCDQPYENSKQQQSFDPVAWIKILRESRKKDWLHILEDSTADVNTILVGHLSCFELSYFQDDFIKNEKKNYIEQQIEDTFKYTEKTGMHPNRSKIIIDTLINLSITLNIKLSPQIQVIRSWIEFQKTGQPASTYFGPIISFIQKDDLKDFKDFFEKYFIFLHERNEHSRSISNKLLTSCGFRTSKTEECAKALIGFCSAFKLTYSREILTANLDFLSEKLYKPIMEPVL